MTGFYEGTGGTQEPVPHDLDFHSDVTINVPLGGQHLVYNSGSGQWENASTVASLEDLTDVTVTGVLDGDILAWNNSSARWENKPDSTSGASKPITANYELVLSDLGKILIVDSASAVTISIPDAVVAGWPSAGSVAIVQKGVGSVSVAAVSAATFIFTDTLTCRTQGSALSLILTSIVDEWILTGDVELI